MLLLYSGILFVCDIMAQGGVHPVAHASPQTASRPSFAPPSSSLWSMKYVFRNTKKEMVFSEYLGTSEGAKEQSYYTSRSTAQDHQAALGHHPRPSAGRALSAAYGVSQAQRLCLWSWGHDATLGVGMRISWDDVCIIHICNVCKAFCRASVV